MLLKVENDKLLFEELFAKKGIHLAKNLINLKKVKRMTLRIKMINISIISKCSRIGSKEVLNFKVLKMISKINELP